MKKIIPIEDGDYYLTLDVFLMTYRIKVSNTHHRVDIRYP